MRDSSSLAEDGGVEPLRLATSPVFEAGVPPLRLHLPCRVTDGNRTRIHAFTERPRGHTSTVTVGVTGIEPATTSTQSSCSTNLSYTPIDTDKDCRDTCSEMDPLLEGGHNRNPPSERERARSRADGGGCSPRTAFGADPQDGGQSDRDDKGCPRRFTLASDQAHRERLGGVEPPTGSFVEM